MQPIHFTLNSALMNGVLVIDKPEDWTSHDVVAKCRKILKTHKIGHTGTLDPFATGVLLLLVGKATRLAQFLGKYEKEYVAEITFGFETDTGDKTGKIKENTRSDGFRLDAKKIQKVLSEFLGEIEQIPPMFSAKKIKGKKLYELARKQIEIERKPVKIKIYEIELLEIKEKSIAVRIVCSSGTYVRTLAEDIGRKLGIGAHLSALRRIRVGKFDLSRAVTLEKLEEALSQNQPNDFLLPMNECLSDFPQIVLDDFGVKRAKNGAILKLNTKEDFADGQFVCMLDAQKNLVAIGEISSGVIQPKIVLG
ncbi:MAG: tRNA pseudouridine(55) synthase TruB [Acidobacteria bacterium]|nr:MAG: tRNA pseudouridine(55) synthase TruB [Acidobacteriota bacterium]